MSDKGKVYYVFDYKGKRQPWKNRNAIISPNYPHEELIKTGQDKLKKAENRIAAAASSNSNSSAWHQLVKLGTTPATMGEDHVLYGSTTHSAGSPD